MTGARGRRQLCCGTQIHAVPVSRAPQLGVQHGEAMRMCKEQVKWVLLWFTLSLLTCMHSAALILALQYNLIAMVRPPLFPFDCLTFMFLVFPLFCLLSYAACPCHGTQSCSPRKEATVSAAYKTCMWFTMS